MQREAHAGMLGLQPLQQPVLQPPEQQGGTFTITNVGPFGMEGGTPIINPGESAILCFGAVSKRPWVVSADGEDRLAVRDVCTLALSFDHRHIDGEKGSAEFDAFADRLDVFDDSAGRLELLDYGADLDSLMLAEFIDVIRTGRKVQPDGEVGYRTLEIVTAAYESQRTNAPVALSG